MSSAGANTLRFSTRPSLPESAANLLSISRPRPAQITLVCLHLLATWSIFLIDVILIRSFPSPAFVQALNVIVWASFAVDYVARLVLSVGEAMFVRTHKLDQLMVLLPMLRFLRIFLLLRRTDAGLIGAVSTTVAACSSRVRATYPNRAAPGWMIRAEARRRRTRADGLPGPTDL